MADAEGAHAAERAPYEILRRLAVGGMAEVFEATAADGREVVLKRMLPKLAREPETVRAFLHEAELGELLTSQATPGLVATLAHGTDKDGPFLVLELVCGAPLSELVLRGTSENEAQERPPREVAVYVVASVLRALAALHEAKGTDGAPLGIVHRDVNPANLLVGPDGDVKLIDLGIARSRLREVRTRTGVIKGKLDYLAPEQVTGSTLDARADVYAAGVLLFELATGQAYLEANDDLELLRKAEAPELRVPSEADGDARLDPLVKRALSRFPEERYRTAQAFLRALEPLATDAGAGLARAWLGPRAKAQFERMAPRRAAPLPSAEPRPSAEPPAIAPPGSRGRFGVIAGALAALIGGGWLASRALQSPPRDRGSALEAPRAAPSAAAPPSAELPASSPTSSEAATPPAAASDRAAATLSTARPLSSTQLVAPSTAAPSAPPASSASPELEALRASLGAARATLAKKHLTSKDLTATDQAALARAEAALAAGDAPAARADVDAVRGAAERASIDAVFVRQKLDRVSARIREAKARGADTKVAEARAASALQSFLDGRYDATNAELDGILASLP